MDGPIFKKNYHPEWDNPDLPKQILYVFTYVWVLAIK